MTEPSSAAGRAGGAGVAGGPGRGSTPALLAVRGLVKRFAEVTALDHVDFTAHAGEIHAVLGENGAGKSTLMHVVSGLYAADAGEIALAGRAVRWRSPEEARAAGIAMVHQHFMLVPTLSIAENLALARGVRGFFAPARLALETSALASRYGLDVGDPARRIEDVSVGDRQRVEILKALVAIEGSPASGGPRFLILDEPTAVLTPDEVTRLFAMLRDLAATGAGVAIVTHKLAEVLSIADRVTVLRGGRVIGGGAAGHYDAHALAALMVGAPARDADAGDSSAGVAELGAPAAPRAPAASGAPQARARLVARGLRARDERGALVLDDVSLEVAPGELLVIAGVEGNGQAELVDALAGAGGEALRDFRGEVALDDRPIASVADARDAGLAVVPADRSREGIVAELPAWENLLLARDRLAARLRRGRLSRREAVAAAAPLLLGFEVQPPDPERPAGALSGGNQQRLILAREIGRERPRAIVAANPTRGLDLAATAAIRRRLREHAAAGAAVVVLSTDLDEVEELAGRVAVLYRGRLLHPAAEPAGRAAIGRLMAGGVEAA